MTLASVPAENVVLLLGAPRSGTTWLAKIFDSHPDVLYRHEPDTVLRNQMLQRFFRDEDIPAFKDAAEGYLRQLVDTRTLKTAGSLPMFPKSYYSTPIHILRRGIVYALRAAEQISGTTRLIKHLPVPDLLGPKRLAGKRVVMKSVSSRGRARLFARALPGCRIIYIVRDPCGQVASVLRGAALGKFEDQLRPEELLHTDLAARYGLTEERLKAMPKTEQLAWNWAILNEKAIEDLSDIPTARVLRYQDLCVDPLGQAKELFEFTGLSWNQQTENFVTQSSRSNAPDRYYQVFKTSTTAMHRWRTELEPEDQRRILGVVRQTGLRALCPEYNF